jgi:hypothetical protein
VESANVTSSTGDEAASGSDTSISLSLKAFVAPPAGTGAPAITTTAK